MTKVNHHIQKLRKKLLQSAVLMMGLGICVAMKAESLPQNTNTANTSSSNPPVAASSSANYLDTQAAVKDTSSSEESGFWSKLWGNPAPPALYLAMVSFHLEPGSRDDNWNNQLIAGTYKGFFAGTLVNSFYDRAYAFGIQRMWGTQQISEHITNSPGYRLGLISGYDDRMMELADHTPLIPFPQVVDDIVIGKHVGIELSWSVVVVSAGFVITF